MPLVGGDLRIVDSTDLCFFGVVSLLYFVWLFTTRRSYLKPLLWYTSLSNLTRTLLALLLLFEFSATRRSDGVEILWVRWAAYALIFGLCGVTQAFCEVSIQRVYYYRWTVSLVLGLSFAAIAVASTVGDEAQRIVSLALTSLPYAAAMLMLWMWAHRRDWKVIVVLASFTFLLLGYPLFYALGHSGWRVGGFSLVWETSCLLVLDAVLISLLPAFAIIIHCPHSCQDAGKKHDHVRLVNAVSVDDGSTTLMLDSNPAAVLGQPHTHYYAQQQQQLQASIGQQMGAPSLPARNSVGVISFPPGGV